jgi:hypothetical protein
MIVQRQHLNSILSELNQAQILILRWLAQQHDHQATWDEFTEALADRMPESWLRFCLDDLRLSGLADFVPEQGSGWIATYPAVASAQPISHGVNLSAVLNAMPTEMLQRLCQRFSVRPTPTSNGKRIEGVTRCLSDHNFLVFLLASLSTGSLELFEWFLERGGMADHNALAKRLGNRYYDAIAYASRMTGSWGSQNVPRPSSPFIDLLECGLVAGVSAHGSSWGYASYFAIPNEVAAAYAGASIFDTEPLVPPQLTSAEPREVHLPNLTTLLRDLSHMRAFISLGRAEWRQDGGPYARSLQAFNKLVGGPTKDYSTALWRMAVEAQLLIASRYSSHPYQAADLSEIEPDAIICKLIEGWALDRTSAYYDYYLPRDLNRRVLSALQTVPTDTWIVRESFETLLAFFSPLALNSTVRSTHPRLGDWSTLYATLLGQGVDDEGRELFQVQSAAMETVLPEDPDAPPKLPEWDSSWVVQPDRTIVVPPNAHPDSLLHLWSVADLVENKGASIFRISSESVSAALNRGMTPDEITGLFEQHARTPIPSTIERVIRDQSQRYGQVRVGRASSYLKVDDPDVLVDIVSNARLNKIKIQIIAPTVAIVEGVDDAATLTNLRRAGYLPIPALEHPPAEPGTVVPERQSGEQIKDILHRAIAELRLVRLQWTDPRVGNVLRDIEPTDLDTVGLTAYAADSDDEYKIPLSIITAARLLTAQESKQYA